MIAIDTDLLLRTQYTQLNTKRTNLNAYNSIDSRTNQQIDETSDNSAIQLNTLDTNEVIQALKLYIPKNRFAILKDLTHQELINLLYLLKKDKLAMGLKFFNKKKLLNFIYALDKKDILKIAFKIFPRQEFINRLSIKGLRAFMDSTKIRPEEMTKALCVLPKSVLAQLTESITGQPAGNKTQEELIKGLSTMKPELLKEGLKNIPAKELAKFIGKLCENNEDLYLEIPKWAMMEPIMKQDKATLMEGMQALEPEQIIKMLSELPNVLLALIDTQIEPDKFTEFLQKFRPDLLSSM